MNKNVLIKSLITAILTWLVVALVFSISRGTTFVQSLVRPETIGIGIAAIVGGYVGFKKKESKFSEEMEKSIIQ